MSPLRRIQSSSGASISLNRSSTDHKRSLSSSREGPHRRPSIAGSSSSNVNCTSAKNSRSDEKKMTKLVKKMKLLASELKHRLDGSKQILSSGNNASHIFKGGDGRIELARGLVWKILITSFTTTATRKCAL